MLIVGIALTSCLIGVVIGIIYAAWLNMRQHAREAQSVQTAQDAAQAYYADADARSEAVCRWMAQSYRERGGIAANAFPDYGAPAVREAAKPAVHQAAKPARFRVVGENESWVDEW